MAAARARQRDNGATGGEDNSLGSDAKMNLSLEGGGGRSPSPVSSSAPKKLWQRRWRTPGKIKEQRRERLRP